MDATRAGWADEPSEPPGDGFLGGVADVDALVDQVLGGRPRPVAWDKLDAAGAAPAWVELDGWVRWLVSRYGLDHREVPPCWFAHGAMVEELSALHTAHRAAFDAAGAPAAPAEWHQVLGSSRVRLQLAAARTGCRPGEHRPDHQAPWVTDPLATGYARAFGTHVEADLDARNR